MNWISRAMKQNKNRKVFYREMEAFRKNRHLTQKLWNQTIEVNKETGEVAMKFKLPVEAYGIPN
ncbi:MAG: hypothetical protein L3J31_00085 [Bacteroidales bacterium]|nr:hypothetical protein [Bacteroidales bacterium]MCF6341187.1 hypothetical protein [Bacteroidales bacterium]